MEPITITLHPGWILFFVLAFVAYKWADGWRAKMFNRLNEYADEDRQLVRGMAEGLRSVPDIEDGKVVTVYTSKPTSNNQGKGLATTDSDKGEKA